jgi:6-phosphogluconolactonase
VASESSSKATRVYVGTYTEPRPGQGEASEGIYVCQMDPQSGALTRESVGTGVVNPSYLAFHPTRPLLYAVSETTDGGVCALAVDPASGGLRLLNREASHGDHPCHVQVDRSGRYALVANYSSGTLAVLPIREDGSLAPASDVVQHVGSGPNERRQSHAYAHSIWPDPAGRFVLSCDLGCDKVFVYRLDLDSGKLIPNDPPFGVTHPGAGPRHLAFHPSDRWVFVIDEIDSTLTVFDYDASRVALAEIECVSTLPAGFTGQSTCADVHVAPSGRLVYGSNRGDDSIVVFAVDESTGHLSYVEHIPTGGRTPRNFALTPDGSLLLAANQDGNDVIAFRVDTTTGRLTPTGARAEFPMPVCLLVRPS